MNVKDLKKILKLRFLLSKKSWKSFSGPYRSKFRGTGVTFSDFRGYSIGDDFRSISWALTAKMGKPYIKVFEEDRGQTFVLMVDVSASSSFGSINNSKSEVMGQIASLIAFATEKNQDQLSLLLFSNQVEHFVRAGKGRNHILRIIQDIHAFKPKSKKTDFGEACRYLQKILKKKSYIFLISDFLNDHFQKPLRFLKQKHQVIGVIVEDPLDSEMPSMGLMDLEDMETGQTLLVDTSSSVFRKDYKSMMMETRRQREQNLKKSGIQYFYLKTNEDIFKPFLQFIQKQRDIM